VFAGARDLWFLPDLKGAAVAGVTPHCEGQLMSVWYPIACLIAVTVIWPFVDVSLRNRRRRRERERSPVRITDA
jgi:hypothetical protein